MEERLRAFLGPLLVAENSKGHDRLVHLCQDALEFALLLRRCRDSYHCEYLAADSDFREDEAIALSWEGQRGETDDPRNKIACSISPVLVKYPEQDQQSRLVLERAHVAVRKDY
ncbi:hypothetical protein BDZ45DRAFT_671829 [Acephala macrosclerotiorum]|nr:hypothetical protein BDZ45DRAFT_671829 [Acephala macrosclerotiorum]